MPRYEVTYKIRKAGASGVFYDHAMRVTALDRRDAHCTAFESLHDDGYETLHLVSIEEIRMPSPEADEHSNHGLY